MIAIAALIILLSPWVASWFFPLPDPVSETRAYSTVLGIALLASYLPIWAVTPLVVWWAGRAAYRAWLWQNEIALHRHAWDHSGAKFRVAVNIGAAYQRLGRMSDALEWHKKALELSPGNGIGLINLGLWYHTQSKALRGMLATQFVEHGVLNEIEYKQRVEEANQCEAQALALVREAVKACPNDPQVKRNAEMVENRAAILGIKVETYRENVIA